MTSPKKEEEEEEEEEEEDSVVDPNANMETEENSEDDTDPMRMLLPDDDEDHLENGTKTLHPEQEMKLNHHHIRSIDSTVVIRQLPSQGLSFQLWPAATTLVNLLDQHRRNPTHHTTPFSSTLLSLSKGEDHPHPHPLRILELGSGTGLVGIAAAVTLCANVTVTDLPNVIANLQFNADANSEALESHGGSVRVAPLRWGENEDMELIGREFDIVMASDVVYHAHLYEPLLETLRYLLGGIEKVVFVMAHLRRWKKESVFFKKARKLFHVQVIGGDDPSQGARVGVVVYRFVGKRFSI